MNGTLYSHDRSNGCYTGNVPVYRNGNSSTIKPNSTNIYLRHSYTPSTYKDIHLQQTKQSNPGNQYNKYKVHFQERQSNLDECIFENNELPSSTLYYDRIHAQVRSAASGRSSLIPSFPSRIHKQSPETSPTKSNSQPHIDSIVMTTDHSSKISPPAQSTIPSPQPIINQPLPNTSVDNLHQSMNSLIQRLAPSDTYKPEESFLYPILLCSRMQIRPSLLLNKLAYLTINSLTYSTHDRGIRTMRNFLYILSQWTRTFPYDFRNTEMISQLEELLRKINSYEPTLQSDTYHIDTKLRSKLNALEKYEDYIRQLNKKAAHSLTQTALFTDIINECPTSVSFAQQLTYIELDRLKPIGAEELIQYYIMKAAMEEARAHPNRAQPNQTTRSNQKTLDIVHDTKLTFCLETYIQWFNRLTYFVTTEIVKHTHKRLRIRLINYFIDAAYECLRLHNFNSMMGIIGGLDMQPVQRLKRTWEKKQIEKFQELSQHINVTRNFANYRHMLKTAMEDADKHGWKTDKIVVPLTSIMLQDVLFIKTHSKDYTPEGDINLEKYSSMAKFILEEFVKCKQSKCSFERNDVIINYIITSPTFNEDSLMLASFECEPPATPNEKQKLSLLQASMNTSSSKP